MKWKGHVIGMVSEQSYKISQNKETTEKTNAHMEGQY